MTANRDNKFIYALKFIACLFVITIHAPFPGLFGEVTGCIAKFAVPFFFAVSGRYLLKDGKGGVVIGTDLIRSNTRRSLLKLLKITGIVYVIYLLFSLILHFIYGHSFLYWLSEKFNLFEARNFFLFNSGQFIYDWTYVFDHLWYLFALIYVYILIYIFAPVLRSWYKALILILLGFLFFGELLQTYYPIRPFGISISTWYVLRNWLFVGMPFVLLGVLFGDKAPFQKVKIRKYRKFALIALFLGMIMSYAEFRIFGTREVYLGSVIMVTALLFLSEAVSVPDNILSNIGKRASGNIYFFHVLVIAVLDQLSQNGIIPLYLGLWKPLIVMAVTVLLFYGAPKLLGRKEY